MAATKGAIQGLMRSAAAWPISDSAQGITGQVLGLDGGFSAVRPMVHG